MGANNGLERVACGELRRNRICCRRLNILHNVVSAILGVKVTRAYNVLAADFFQMRNSRNRFLEGRENMMRRRSASVATAAMLLAMSASQRQASAEQAAAAVPAAPLTKFEKAPQGEAEQIGQIISLTTQLLQMRYPEGMARRGVHPKDHGCVKATFTVNSDIPPNYRAGVFATPGKKYPAWIRFSNATPFLAPDLGKNGPDSRGMAIKLIGVEGETLLNEPGAKTQDFLLINLPGFAFPNVSEYLEVTKIQLAKHDDISSFFAPPLSPEKKKTLGVVKKIQQTNVGNPLESPYFSAAPFLYGSDRVAKFSVTPRSAEKTPVPANPTTNYLREAMKKSLDPANGKPAVFDFKVQLRNDDSLPIEDATAEWSETTAPPQNVATIEIDQQDFDNAFQVTECEHMAFTPWHGLTAHQPIGGINRLRRDVYIASSKFRSQPKEPTGFPKWPW
ncbi:catalase [Methylocystis rosea]|uniref:Catalase n=2 Tax=Methylocystis rosea TaxID=173366 RepID=A0A3G8M6V1_9HYPH|nr:catalase [Methylocystis rosea]